MFWSKPIVAAALGSILIFALFIVGATTQQHPTPAPRPSASTQSTPAEAAKHVPPESFVMIDPSHGGDDSGATLAPGVREKDVTLSFSRELKKELEERGIAVKMLRDSDVNLGLERRAELANEQRPGIYLAVHAGPPGKGLRVYAPLLLSRQIPLAGRFFLWDSAQSVSLDRSKALARAVSSEAKKHDLQVVTFQTPLRPLNNITVPAIAVELAPEDKNPHSAANQKRLSDAASAIAAGLAQARGQWEAHP